VSQPVFNPLRATEIIHNNYFNFFETSFSPNNPRLAAELRVLKDRGYIWRSPYISISQPYVEGMAFDDFVKANSLSSQLVEGFSYIRRLHFHQENAIENLLKGRSTIISSGTGSGKTEAFLIPILEYLLKHNDAPGVKVIIVYPMNALVNDQVERLRKILFRINDKAARKITFASYTGNTEETPQLISKMAEVCPEPGCGKNLYPQVLNNRGILRCDRNPSVSIDYQILSRKEIRENPPDILITNYVELEYLLLRKSDENLFSSNALRFVVLDEIHTYSGAQGVDVAMLVRRLKRRVERHKRAELVFVGTSATLSSEKDEKERKAEVSLFASSLFGETFRETDVFEGKSEQWRFDKVSSLGNVRALFETAVEDLDTIDEETFVDICRKLSDVLPSTSIIDRKVAVGRLLLNNPLFQVLLKSLEEPRDKEELIDQLVNADATSQLVKRLAKDPTQLEDIVWDYLKLGSMAAHPTLSDRENYIPLIRVNFHNFFKTIDDLYLCHKCRTIYNSPRDDCEKCSSSVDRLGVCRFCGSEFFISLVKVDEFKDLVRNPIDSEIVSTIGETPKNPRLQKLSYTEDAPGTIELWQSYVPIANPRGDIVTGKMAKCLSCGSIGRGDDSICDFCKSPQLISIHVVARNRVVRNSQPTRCPFCGNSYGRFSALSPISMSSNTASTTLFDIAYYALPPESRKMLIFTDNKQAASYLAGFLEVAHRSHMIRKMIYHKLTSEFDGRFSFSEAMETVVGTIRDWYGGDFEGFMVREDDVVNDFNKEISSVAAAQRSLENLGLVEITYDGLESLERFSKSWKSYKDRSKPGPIIDRDMQLLRRYLISFLDIIRQDGAMRGLERMRWFERDNAVGYSLRKDHRSYRGIDIKNMTGKSGSIALLTEKVFGLDDEAGVEEIIVRAYDYLTANSLLIRATISKRKSTADAHIVSSSKIVIRIPIAVKLCGTCRRIYVNSPEDKCLTYRCDGLTQELSYESHLKSDRPDYYMKLYTSGEPARMVTREDTGALDLEERRFIETEFKSDDAKVRKIDVVVATPTLELGVDIGDLLSVGLFKSPPAPVNYVQRVGRAGRVERISLNNAFMFLNPIDIYYYYRPSELIKGEIVAPVLDVENEYMLRRHVNALILEDLFIYSSLRGSIPQDMRPFVGTSSIDLLLKELEKRKQIILDKIKDSFADVTIKMSDKKVGSFLTNFASDLDRSVRLWREELDRYSSHARDVSGEMAGKTRSETLLLERRYDRITGRVRTLERTNILQQFMTTGLLPRYAFPGVYVNIEEEYGRDTFGGQNRNYAISEYAPGTEATLRKQIYESVGIDLKFSKPKWTTFHVCGKCRVFVREAPKPETCPLCHQKTDWSQYESLAPETILLRRSQKPINELREYRETISDVFLKLEPSELPLPTKAVDNFELRRIGSVEMVQIVSGLWYEDESEPRKIELCNKCGRARGGLRDDRHTELGGRISCNGRFQPVNLFHAMPTNVISLKIVGQSLYGAPVEQTNDRFLITLKNAIINASQILVRADDGEIEGIVKNQELYLYDNVEGGVGYVNQIFERFGEIMLRAAEMVLNPEDKCELGCVKCLYSYRRKRDIPKIDKSVIRPILERAKVHHSSERLKDAGEVQSYRGSEITTLVSPAFSLSGATELKNIVESAQNEIKITSLYVTDDPIEWPDEGRRSWVDILSSIKQNRDKQVAITIIVRRPTSNEHRRALRRLSDAGIEVLIYEKEVEGKLQEIVRTALPGIVHSKLVVVDPQTPSSRYAIISSANFSPEMWKNHDTYNFGRDEDWVKGTYMAIRTLEKESRRIDPYDVMIPEGVSSKAIVPGMPGNEMDDLGYRLAKASSEIWIMDPYITKEKECFSYLARWVKRGTQVSIITARVDSNRLKRELDEFRGKGNVIKVIRYFDKEKETGRETILHDRYVVIDRKCVVRLGKGINGVIEAQGGRVADNVIMDIMESPTLVAVYVKNFQDFLDFENNSSELIRTFPKETY
jgi:ATP-dependent helicase YprA (DUF1998 family)